MKILYADNGEKLVGLSKNHIIYLGWVDELEKGELPRYRRIKSLADSKSTRVTRTDLRLVFNDPRSVYNLGKGEYESHFDIEGNQELEIGCCLFDKKTTGIIRRWAFRKAK
jgi:hypothetical protein